jgi:hypothetical protein
MEQLKKLYLELDGLAKEGVIITEEIAKKAIKRMLFDSLESEHAKDYHGLDDNMPDSLDQFIADRCEEDSTIDTIINDIKIRM